LFVREVTDVKLARAHTGCAAGVCIVEDPMAAAPTSYQETEEEGEVAAQITPRLPSLPGRSEAVTLSGSAVGEALGSGEEPARTEEDHPHPGLCLSQSGLWTMPASSMLGSIHNRV
jgi:hypothetical protein